MRSTLSIFVPLSYNQSLNKDPHTKDIWSLAFGKEFGNLVQGGEVTGTEGTNSAFVMSHNDIKTIPNNQVVR